MATEQELIDALKESLEREGHVEQMKKEIIDHYKSGSDNAGKVEKLDDIALLNQLVKDYLNWIGYKYTDIIFAAESYSEPISADQQCLLEDLGVEENSKTKNLPLLYCLVETLKDMDIE